MPTKPPCIGSWPLPPPLITPTLPWRGASLRITTLLSKSTRMRSPWAASMPCKASATTLSTLLISFFIIPLLLCTAVAVTVRCPRRDRLRRGGRPGVRFPAQHREHRRQGFLFVGPFRGDQNLAPLPDPQAQELNNTAAVGPLLAMRQPHPRLVAPGGLDQHRRGP